MTRARVLERLAGLRLLPVIVLDSVEHAVPLARALSAGGLPAAEITFGTPAARASVERIAAECPDVLVGAGTVLTPEQVIEARDAGAQFIVSPGLNPRVVKKAKDLELSVFPGICTPTEIERAMAFGLDVVTFFPAEPIGGVRFLQAMAAPYGPMRFLPAGGITAENVVSYIALDIVVACGGSWMAPAERIRAGDFEWIRAEAAKAVKLALDGRCSTERKRDG